MSILFGHLITIFDIRLTYQGQVTKPLNVYTSINIYAESNRYKQNHGSRQFLDRSCN